MVGSEHRTHGIKHPFLDQVPENLSLACAGQGALTKHLIKAGAYVLAVEKDAALSRELLSGLDLVGAKSQDLDLTCAVPSGIWRNFCFLCSC